MGPYPGAAPRSWVGEAGRQGRDGVVRRTRGQGRTPRGGDGSEDRPDLGRPVDPARQTLLDRDEEVLGSRTPAHKGPDVSGWETVNVPGATLLSPFLHRHGHPPKGPGHHPRTRTRRGPYLRLLVDGRTSKTHVRHTETSRRHRRGQDTSISPEGHRKSSFRGEGAHRASRRGSTRRGSTRGRVERSGSGVGDGKVGRGDRTL